MRTSLNNQSCFQLYYRSIRTHIIFVNRSLIFRLIYMLPSIFLHKHRNLFLYCSLVFMFTCLFISYWFQHNTVIYMLNFIKRPRTSHYKSTIIIIINHLFIIKKKNFNFYIILFNLKSLK
jgi:Zn-dependent protease with chaperone function